MAEGMQQSVYGTQPSGIDSLGEALRLAANGEEVGMRRIHDALCARILGMALRILGDRHLAEEVVIETFAQVWRQARLHTPLRGSISTWVLMIAHSRALDLKRKRVALREEIHDPEQHVVPTTDLTLGHAVDSERATLVRAALDELPDEQRAAVCAAFIDGLTHAEVATQLAVPVGTAKSRIRSGLSRLRLRLSQLEGEPS